MLALLMIALIWSKTSGVMDGQKGDQMDGQIDGQVYRQTYVRTDIHMNRRTDGQRYGFDRRTDGQTYRRTYQYRATKGLTGGWPDR